jgi:hypothetical protein
MGKATSEEMVACIERELRLRAHVYPKRVADSKMSQGLADKEMRVMAAVLEVVRALPKDAPELPL